LEKNNLDFCTSPAPAIDMKLTIPIMKKKVERKKLGSRNHHGGCGKP
jgi:hypothetical protein